MPSPGETQGEFDIVILRHGVQGPDDNHYDENPFHNAYQLLPNQPDASYWLAGAPTPASGPIAP